ncbi:MAG: hypothetical protein M3R53_05835 [Candidatus Eremiobacteraeota bacterium]|nr:hypothetical protein [Candidatus Eremiobacteraeota bacterium]
MLQSAAAARLGEDDAAERLLLTARAYVFSTDAPALEAELEYYGAYAALERGELQQAAAACRRLLRVEPSGRPSEYVVPLRHLRARAFELLGFVRAARGNYGAAAALTFKASDEFGRSRVADIFEEAHYAAGLAVATCDLDLADRVPDVRSLVDALRWTGAVASLRFRSLEALGWCAALHGDYYGAFRFFRRAGTGATVPQEITIGADRALLACALEQRSIAAEEIGYALDLAERFDWKQCALEDRATLVRLAQAAAPLETVRARAALDHYAKLQAPSVPQALHGDVRTRADEAFARGIVARAEGNIGQATDALRAAFQDWSAIGFAWRAARAAVELSEIDGSDAFHECVRGELKVRASSWFAKRAAASDPSA